MFTLRIDTDNAAFYDHDENFAPAPEVARILSVVANQVLANDHDHHAQTVRDINGNDVGRFRLTEEER